MSLGTVKWVDVSKGDGFIAPDDGGSELFVHLSDIGGGSKLFVGATVEFERRDGMRGRIVAKNVVVRVPIADDPEHVERGRAGRRAGEGTRVPRAAPESAPTARRQTPACPPRGRD